MSSSLPVRTFCEPAPLPLPLAPSPSASGSPSPLPSFDGLPVVPATAGRPSVAGHCRHPSAGVLAGAQPDRRSLRLRSHRCRANRAPWRRAPVLSSVSCRNRRANRRGFFRRPDAVLRRSGRRQDLQAKRCLIRHSPLEPSSDSPSPLEPPELSPDSPGRLGVEDGIEGSLGSPGIPGRARHAPAFLRAFRPACRRAFRRHSTGHATAATGHSAAAATLPLTSLGWAFLRRRCSTHIPRGPPPRRRGISGLDVRMRIS